MGYTSERVAEGAVHQEIITGNSLISVSVTQYVDEAPCFTLINFHS
jgi:hypothetical protein